MSLISVTLTAEGKPVRPLRVLRGEAEWAIFRELKEHALNHSYSVWKEWVKANIAYSASAKVARQVGLVTPGREVPSSLFYRRLRNTNSQGLIISESPEENA